MSPRATFLPRLGRPNKKTTWLTPDDFDNALALAKKKKKTELRLLRQKQSTKWQHADHGFAYAPGPVIYKPWYQYTLREAAVQTGRWLMLYLLIAIVVNVLEYFDKL